MKHKYFGVFMIVVEILALGFLFLPASIEIVLIPFLIVHITASTLTILWVRMSIPKVILYQKRGNFYYLSAYCYLLPVIGNIFMVVRAERLLSIDFLVDLDKIKLIPQPYFESETIFTPTRFGEGGAFSRLRNERINVTRRIRALLAIETCADKQRNITIRETLYDNEDEVRLLAFGLLEIQEKEITEKIHLLNKELEKQTSPQNMALTEKKLAFCYWELVYQNLAVDDLKNFAIEMTMKYTSNALKILEDDIGLHILLAKIHLDQEDHKQAEEVLKKCQQLGAPFGRILPYLAELAYIKRDLKLLRSYLKENPKIVGIPLLNPIYKYWCESK